MDNNARVDSLIASYIRLLLWQYQKPKAQQTIAILAKQMVADGILFQIQNGYTLGTAVGAQLDVLGKYVGLPRNIGDPTPLPFFGFVDYAGGGNTNGLTDYTSGVNKDVVFYEYDYNQQNATSLSDTAYLYMLLLKIALNTGDMTLYGIQQTLATTLGGAVRVEDNRDMSLTYYVDDSGLPVSISTLTPYLPKPMGVRIANVVSTFNLITSDGDNIVTGDGDQIISNNA